MRLPYVPGPEHPEQAVPIYVRVVLFVLGVVCLYPALTIGSALLANPTFGDLLIFYVFFSLSFGGLFFSMPYWFQRKYRWFLLASIVIAALLAAIANLAALVR
jgi:hypothetical protein